jgi:hypothetical protein
MNAYTAAVKVDLTKPTVGDLVDLLTLRRLQLAAAGLLDAPSEINPSLPNAAALTMLESALSVWPRNHVMTSTTRDALIARNVFRVCL